MKRIFVLVLLLTCSGCYEIAGLVATMINGWQEGEQDRLRYNNALALKNQEQAREDQWLELEKRRLDAGMTGISEYKANRRVSGNPDPLEEERQRVELRENTRKRQAVIAEQERNRQQMQDEIERLRQETERLHQEMDSLRSRSR